MASLPFKIKICGITTPGDAGSAAAAGADAIGLNFYAGSKRCVSLEVAAEIAAAVPPQVTKVGVFVNPSYEEVVAATDQVPLDMLQFHGSEAPEFLAQFHDHSIIRAWRFENANSSLLDEYLGCCSRLKTSPCALLFDSGNSRQYGGTGEVADWNALAAWSQKSRVTIPVILAGGLTPQNVAAAVAAVGPVAVDTASGVESSPGRKDPELMIAFVRAAQQALASL